MSVKPAGDHHETEEAHDYTWNSREDLDARFDYLPCPWVGEFRSIKGRSHRERYGDEDCNDRYFEGARKKRQYGILRISDTAAR